MTDVSQYSDIHVVCRNQESLNPRMRHSFWLSIPVQVTDLMTGRNGNVHDVVHASNLDPPAGALYVRLCAECRRCFMLGTYGQ